MQKIEVIKEHIDKSKGISINLEKFNKEGWVAKSFNVIDLTTAEVGPITIAVLFEKPDTVDAEKVKQKLNEATEKVKNIDLGGMVKSYTDLLGSLEKSLEKAFEEKEN